MANDVSVLFFNFHVPVFLIITHKNESPHGTISDQEKTADSKTGAPPQRCGFPGNNLGVYILEVTPAGGLSKLVRDLREQLHNFR